MRPNHLNIFISLVCMVVGLSACSSSNDDNNAATTFQDSNLSANNGISSIGTITGFGSIFVNGIQFETDNSSFRVDDEVQFDESTLAVGMKVKIKGTINADGATGTATSIIYDDDVEGPIDAGSLKMLNADAKAFTVLGLSVIANATRTVYDNGISFDTLAEGKKIEVSGYFDGSQIIASRLEKQSDQDDEYELKGFIANYDAGNTVTLRLQNGASAGPYTISSTAQLDIPLDPTDLFVELKLKEQSGGSLLVTSIEADDADMLDEGDNEVSIRGALQADGNNGFLINGIAVQMGNNTKYKPTTLQNNLTTGRQIKIEGVMQNGVLIAQKIETEQGDIKFQASVEGVSTENEKNGRITVCLCNYMLNFQADNSTQFEDTSSFDLNDDGSFNLSELSATGFVKVEAYESDFGQLFATSIQRMDAGKDTRLEARISSFVADTSVTFSLAGVDYTYHVYADTSYKINQAPSDAASFFAALSNNSIVKVKDVNPADGTAEELILEE